ncbi:hypothetical protein BDA99DRAFT_541007 [Phascolomyces articulosus]|uniref:Uncharacterized protein n=1 Tax=Phascolomyces articulosus TaxID=60185 RepID=A0AAD5PAG4_9FUNG|nr:hypothetical protein BDA99DRAFT_541007 [Phascolomyces articulosus]
MTKIISECTITAYTYTSKRYTNKMQMFYVWSYILQRKTRIIQSSIFWHHLILEIAMGLTILSWIILKKHSIHVHHHKNYSSRTDEAFCMGLRKRYIYKLL